MRIISTVIRSLSDALHRPHSTVRVSCRVGVLLAVVALICCVSPSAVAQQVENTSSPIIVQPGAPGQPTKVLPSTTRATLPPRSAKDVEFMQGMIMHHSQAVEMTALILSHTDNKALLLLGDRISHSQSDEMDFMRRWLVARGESTSMPMAAMPDMPSMPGMDMSGHHHEMLMPGMLTAKQMDALRSAKGAEFDRLFLTGMIQHHGGALTMVKDLYNAAGSGQDAEIFSFTTDVDSGQRAEIRIMENMLKENRKEEK